MQKIAETLRSS